MKGQAILIGLNDVDKRHYKESVYSIKESEQNVKDFYNKLVGLNSMEITEKDQLLGRKATLKNLKKKIKEKQEQATDEEIFLLIYFTGHGDSINGSKYRFYLLYDQMILNHEVLHLLNGFDQRFKILVVLDTCYAGGLGYEKAREKSFKYILHSRDRRKYKNKMAKFSVPPKQYNCSLAFYFSAGENERSRHFGGSRYLTPFTSEFLRAGFDENFDGNFYQLEEKLIHSDSLKIKECFRVLGGQTYFFRNTIPFKINVNNNPQYQYKMSWTIDVDYHNNNGNNEKVTATITNTDQNKSFYFMSPVYVERSELPEEILDQYPEINHAMRVTYEEVASGGVNEYEIKVSNSKLSYILPHNNDLDSVVYIQNNATGKIKSKPVKGDVENGGGVG